MSSLSLQGISKSFGSTSVLHDVDLHVEHGEFVVLVGPSGCGKSTLLRLIAGLETIDAGSFLMEGRQMNTVKPAKRGIGMVFQSYALYPHMTVAENISFGLRLQHMPKQKIDARLAEVSRVLKLDSLMGRKPRALSGGQRQRVAIGRALVQEPDVFLFDEPLSNLDAKLRVSMRVEIAKLHQRLGSTMIYVTHDQVEALTLADRIVVMNRGRIEQIGTPLDLYHRPSNLFVAGFIGSPEMNFIPGRIVDVGSTSTSIVTDSGFKLVAEVDSARARPGDAVTVGIRPESVREGPGVNTMVGTVEVTEHLGEVTYLYMAVAGAPETFVMKAEGTAAPREGQTIQIDVRSSDLHVFDAQGAALLRTNVETRSDALPGRPLSADPGELVS